MDLFNINPSLIGLKVKSTRHIVNPKDKVYKGNQVESKTAEVTV